MSTQTLSEWLGLLETRHPVKIELGLDRIRQVAQRLALVPSINTTDATGTLKCSGIAKQVVTVAGTNGKGSCVAVISSILTAAGYRVGAYTSPHLIHYNERVSIKGEIVSDNVFCDAFERIEEARVNVGNDLGHDISLSYFEFGTLAALLIMADADLDVAILEVGLGGRLDAVNLIDTDIAVVTSIALDHEDWLGSDLNGIAAEKAAISRQGKPLICGDTKPLEGLINTAAQIGAQLLVNERDFSFSDIALTRYSTLAPQSVACALQAVALLAPKLSQQTLAKGLAQVKIYGRYQQVMIRGIEVVLDVAHNPQAAGLLAERLLLQKGRVTAIFGCMKDKNIGGIFECMKTVVDSWYFCDLPTQERAANARHLTALMYNNREPLKNTSLSVNITECSSPLEAFKQAMANISKEETLVVFGSFFTVGPVLSWINNNLNTAQEQINSHAKSNIPNGNERREGADE